MKTTKIFSVLSLALIFVGVTAGFSKKVESVSSKIVQGPGIIYRVSIHPDLMTTPCGTYLVQVVDETGRLVAPAQVFVPGVNGYSFNEKISAFGNMHSRKVAMLIQVKTPSYYNCSTPLFALPDIKIGPFLAGHFYTFDLYLQTKTNSIN